MNMKRISLVLVMLILFTGAFCSVNGEEKVNPEVPDNKEAAKPKDVIKYSDGQEKIGKLSLRGETALTVFNLERKDTVKVALADISKIDVEIESATMEKVWRFIEEGSPEKIFTGEEYPLHKYITVITLLNGVVIRTHLSAVLYLKNKEGKLERVFLLTKQAGTVENNLEDLVYIKHITFFDRRLIPGGGKLTVLTKPGEKPSAAVAIQASRNQSFRGEMNKTGFIWSDLPPDKYDIVVVSGKTIHYCLSAVAVSSGGKKSDDDLEDLDEKKIDGKTDENEGGLTEERIKELTEYIATADEFFESKEALDFGGNNKMVRSLVRQKRINETSYGTVKKKITLWRFDIWFLHQIQDEWKIEKRAFLWRAYLPLGDLSGLPKLKIEKRLGLIDLSKSRKSIVVDLGKPEE